MGQMMMYTPFMSNYYLCNFFKKIDNKKLEKNNRTYNDVHILHIKRYAISICGYLYAHRTVNESKALRLCFGILFRMSHHHFVKET
jgi:hypothetical protein